MRDRILAHRGFWLEPQEKNSAVALQRAFAAGFGVETDVRDLNGTLVISHDPPIRTASCLTLDDLLNLYVESKADSWIALNVKSDGLAEMVQRTLQSYEVSKVFAFDMSVPDMRTYLRHGIPTFTRRSDIEQVPTLYAKSIGVWLDSFDIPYSPNQWLDDAVSNRKFAALVSPELHGRDHSAAWSDWGSRFSMVNEEHLMLCTDFPAVALDFFCRSK